MLSLKQIDDFFDCAQIVLFFGIVGIFLGYIFHSDLMMNISFGVELFVGLLFIVPLLTAIVKSQIELIKAVCQATQQEIKEKELKQ